MSIMYEWVLPCVFTFAASVGFCFIFNVHGPGILICGLGGLLSWLFYLVSAQFFASEFICFLLAAAGVALYSEIMARIRMCPVTSYLIIALLPLVPGSGIYEAMLCCVRGQSQLFLANLTRTFGLAGALALGILLGSSLFRLLAVPVIHFHKRRGGPRS